MSAPVHLRRARLHAISAMCLVHALAATVTVAQAQQTQLAPAEGSAVGSSAPPVPGQAAEALTADVLLGRWCGDTTNYIFTGTELTVQFHTGGTRVLRIDHIKTGDGWIDVHWEGKRPDGSSNNTVFTDFSPERDVMFQAANVGGDKGPRRRFRRC